MSQLKKFLLTANDVLDVALKIIILACICSGIVMAGVAFILHLNSKL